MCGTGCVVSVCALRTRPCLRYVGTEGARSMCWSSQRWTEDFHLEVRMGICTFSPTCCTFMRCCACQKGSDVHVALIDGDPGPRTAVGGNERLLSARYPRIIELSSCISPAIPMEPVIRQTLVMGSQTCNRHTKVQATMNVASLRPMNDWGRVVA